MPGTLLRVKVLKGLRRTHICDGPASVDITALGPWRGLLVISPIIGDHLDLCHLQRGMARTGWKVSADSRDATLDLVSLSAYGTRRAGKICGVLLAGWLGEEHSLWSVGGWVGGLLGGRHGRWSVGSLGCCWWLAG